MIMSERNMKMALWHDKQQGKCANNICKRIIARNDEYFIDLLRDADYCQQCGIMLRYHRKKARQRNSIIPLTFYDVGQK